MINIVKNSNFKLKYFLTTNSQTIRIYYDKRRYVCKLFIVHSYAEYKRLFFLSGIDIYKTENMFEFQLIMTNKYQIHRLMDILKIIDYKSIKLIKV